jgi:thiamine-phosphate pyrophosphorylase
MAAGSSDVNSVTWRFKVHPLFLFFYGRIRASIRFRPSCKIYVNTDRIDRIRVRIPAFYPILDTGTTARLGVDVASAARAILEAGAGMLQFRHKGFFSREVWEELGRVAALCREAHALLVVNDRADLDRLTGARLHLGQDDLAPADARRVVGPETPIGFSTHNQRQLLEAAAEPVEYLALGPIFGTISKENPDPVVGLDELRRLRPLTPLPLVAIGGITRANARSVLAAGADAVAVIGDLLPGDGDIRGRAEEWIRLLRT